MNTSQSLIHHTAGCYTCGASCSARNALAWALNHVKAHPTHSVELSLAYHVTAAGKAAFRPVHRLAMEMALLRAAVESGSFTALPAGLKEFVEKLSDLAAK